MKTMENLEKALQEAKNQRNHILKDHPKNGEFPAFDPYQLDESLIWISKYGTDTTRDLPEGAVAQVRSDYWIMIKNGKRHIMTVDEQVEYSK